MVSGKFYKVHTEHSYWFLFAEIVERDVRYITDFDFMYTGEMPEDKQAGIDELFRFYYEKKEVPKSEGDEQGERILDYAIDSDLIYAAIMQTYKIDLFEKQIHWHKLRALISGLKDTKLNDIMGYRCSPSGKNKEIDRMKRIWALPIKQSEEDKAALERFNAQFE